MSGLASQAAGAVGDAGEAFKDAVEDQMETKSTLEDSLYPLGVIALLGASVSLVTYQLWNHYYAGAEAAGRRGHYLMPGIWLLLGSGGGLAALLFVHLYRQCHDTKTALNAMMRMSPVVYGIVFLAAVIPGMQMYLHPGVHRQ